MAEQTPETPEPNEPVVFNIAEATDEQLLAEYARVKGAGQELSAKADADPAELTGLSTQLQELSAAVQERRTRAEAAQAARDAFSNAPELTIPTQVIPETSAPVTPDNDVTPSETAPAPVPSVSQMAAQTQLPAVPAKPETGGTTITAHVLPSAAGFVRKQAGETFSGNTEISHALIQNAQSFGSKGAPGTRQAIAQFRRQRENDLVVDTTDGNETMRILRHGLAGRPPGRARGRDEPPHHRRPPHPRRRRRSPRTSSPASSRRKGSRRSTRAPASVSTPSPAASAASPVPRRSTAPTTPRSSSPDLAPPLVVPVAGAPPRTRKEGPWQCSSPTVS
jgi:hypothetical protein